MFALAAPLCLGPTRPTQAENPAGLAKVALASGRHWTAALDARTDRDHLWLRWGSDQAVILRPVAWDRVVQVQWRGRSYSAEQFSHVVEALKASGQLAAEPSPAKPVVGPTPESPPVSAKPSSAAVPPRVSYITLESRAGNWDADAESDGLIVEIQARDAQGQPAVDGLLEAELIGEKLGIVRQPQPFGRLGWWSIPVRQSHFRHGTAQYRLPFQSVHPEFDRTWAPYGAVLVRLSVPGHGVFEASDTMVRIRQPSPIRDRLEQRSGKRFFPQEITASGRH